MFPAIRKLFLAGLLLAVPLAPAAPAAEQLSVQTPSATVADSLRDALSSGEWSQVLALFDDRGSTLLPYLAARWREMREGKLDPVAWEITFEPYYTRGDRLAGQLSVVAREASGRTVGRRFDLEWVRLAGRWRVGEDIPYTNQDFSIQRHDLAVDLTHPDGVLRAEDTLTLSPSGPDRRVFLKLNSALRVQNVSCGNQALPFTQHHEVLYLERPDSSAPMTVTVRYQGSLPGSDWDFINSAGSVLRSEFPWYPRMPIGTTFAVYSVKARVAPQQQAIAVGDLDGVDRFKDAWVYAWTSTAPVEGETLYAGAYERFDAQASETRLEAYLPGSRRDQAVPLLAEAAHVLDFYNNHFGRYPYRKLALVETGFPGGYGASSAVSLPHVAFDDPGVTDEFLAHEIAHNWTDRVTYRGSMGERGFMAEGVASYLDLLYHAERDGAMSFRRELMAARDHYMRMVGTEDDLPLSQASQDGDRAVWQTLTYDKGAMVLNMLRQQVGARAFDAALQDLYGHHTGEAIAIGDFQAAFERASKSHLGWFFEQWLNRAGLPVLAPENLQVHDRGGGRFIVSGTMRQVARPYTLTVPLVVQTDHGGMLYELPLRSYSTPFKLNVSARPRKLLLDPLGDALLVPMAPITLPAAAK